MAQIKKTELDVTPSATKKQNRKALFASLIAVSLLVPLFAVGTAQASSEADKSEYYGWINDLRAAHGLGPLEIRADVEASAQAWSNSMAANLQIAHDPTYSSQVSNWVALAENVGHGSHLNLIWDSFLESPTHVNNIIGPYSHVGVGITIGSDGWIYITHRFLTEPAPAPTTTTPPPTTPTTTAPAPAPPVTNPAVASVMPAPAPVGATASPAPIQATTATTSVAGPTSSALPPTSDDPDSVETEPAATVVSGSASVANSTTSSTKRAAASLPTVTGNGTRIIAVTPADSTRAAIVLDALAHLD